MKSLQGRTLVATPDLRDPNFMRTVIFMVTHNAEGALGLVLNRPTSVDLQSAWQQVSSVPCPIEEKIYLGGPCQGPLMVLHTHDEFPETEVHDGIYFTAKPEELTALVALTETPQRYFVGYAGWTAGQLEHELQEGSWLVTDLSAEAIFTSPDQLDQFWARTIKRIADARLIAELKIKHVPRDPTLN